MALLTLGTLELDGFEIPAAVRFGGAQSLAVHRLIGGARIIDAMGRDDAPLAWQGIFAGADASDRARLLDAMRVAGDTLPLSWDVYCYAVVIDEVMLDYRNPWWIEYRIRCTVLSDLAQSADDASPDLSESVMDDLNSAAPFVAVAGAIAQLSGANALVPGTGGLLASTSVLASLQQSLGATITAQGQGLNAADLGSVVGAAGALAQASAAAGYVGRALANLEAAGS
jgi:hypothetical protein